LKEKSFAFALDVISLYKILSGQKSEYVLSKQLLPSGTSVGQIFVKLKMLKVRPTLFIHKLSISHKE
jgi:four helix bundle protein